MKRFNYYFSLLKRALACEELDYTKGKLSEGLWVLAIPMVLEMIGESVFAVVDVFWVGKLGASAVAVVGLTESVNTLVYAVGIGLSMGTTAMVARRIGEKNKRGARIAATQAILLGAIASIPIALIGLFGPDWVLRSMGASEATVSGGAGYTQVLLSGNIVIIELFIINAIFRAAGDASLAMKSLWFANFFNLVLDPFLIFGWGPFPEMGVEGAAWATNIGRALGVLFQLVLLHRRGRINLRWIHWRWHQEVIWKLFRISLGGMGQFFVATSSWIILIRILAPFGDQVLAGYTVAIRLLMFTILPAWGFSNAAATLVGQNLGAKELDRAEASVWLSGKVNTVFLTSVGLVFFLFPEFMLRFLVDDPVILEHGVHCLRWVSLGYPFYALGMVLVQSFNGAGDTKTPTFLNFVCFWMTEIPLAILLAQFVHVGPIGVYLAIAISESFMTILAWWFFRKGSWKHIDV